MPWITINSKSCQSCGTCICRCPANFRMTDGGITPANDPGRCIRCGHCVALCPHSAITHHGLADHPLEPLKAMTSKEAAAFAELVKARRSHRRFEETPVPREILYHLVDLCRFAPTGGNTQTVGLKIIEDRKRIATLSRAAVVHFTTLIDQLDRSAEEITATGQEIPDALKRDIERHRRYRGMQKSLDKGRDPIFHHAPAVVIFHASKESRTPKDDSVIAAHTMTLGATASDLGCCYIGLFTRAANESPEVLSAVDLPPDHRVFSTLVLGVPKLSFRRTVPRRPLPVTWK